MAEAEGGSSVQGGRLADLDTSVAHPARVYDYWLGGKDNFAADREAAERVLAAAPGLRYRVRANRAFLGRATRYLAAEAGVRQFLDIGAGLPSTQNTHDVAQRVAPDSRVIYVDNDPLVMSHARALLRSVASDTTGYIEGDLRDPAMIAAVAREKLDFTKPVAIMLMGILGHIGNPAEHDDEYALSLVDCLKEELPAGGYLVLRDATDTHPEHVQALRKYAETGAVPYRLRTPEQITRFFDGLQPVEPGIVPVQQWRPDEESSLLPGDINMWGGVALKPAA
jgi:O-methyltransferase involved in polyketide biosynthesis